LCFFKEKDVSITIIGIGEDWPKQQHKLKVKGMADDYGELFFYEDFDELISGFDDAECCKLVLFIIPFDLIFFHGPGHISSDTCLR